MTIDKTTFANGVNDAIRALRAVYSGVWTMFTELELELGQSKESPCLYDIGVRPRPAAGKTNVDEKVVRTWEGRFYTDTEPGDGDADDDGPDGIDAGEDESAKGQYVMLDAGQSIAFVKVVLFASESEPHLLYGVLRNCHVLADWKELKARKGALHKVLEAVRSDMNGKLETQASVVPPSKASKKGSKLVFQVEPPMRVALFDVSGHHKTQEIAADLKRLWAAR